MGELKTLSAIEIAKIAIDIESDGRSFYLEASKASSDERIKSTFAELAAKELDHINMFRNLYKDLDAQMGGGSSSTEYLFDDTITSYLKALSSETIFPPEQEIQTWIASQNDQNTVVKFAMNIEKSSILFYVEIIEHTPFIHSKQLLENIIKEEKSHLKDLAALL